MLFPRKQHKHIYGFTLIEILIVVVIIGMLAALIGPKVVGRLSESKEKIARQQIEMLSTAVELFRIDVGRYPYTREGLNALIVKPDTVPEGLWKGPYLKRPTIPKDPWGNSYVYFGPDSREAKEAGVDFIIISYGADGKPGGSGEYKDISNLSY